MHIAGQLYSQFCCFCPVSLSNCGHECLMGVRNILCAYNENGHIDELVFLLIEYLYNVERIALRQSP